MMQVQPKTMVHAWNWMLGVWWDGLLKEPAIARQCRDALGVCGGLFS